MGSQMQYCGLMTLAVPLWVGTAAKLAGRMLANPARYYRKVDRSAMNIPDPVPDMKHVLVDNAGVRIHAATHGIGSGKPLLVMLHGFPETWACWRNQIQEFAGEYEIAAIDMRGYGDSDVPKGVRQYTVDKLCADVAAVITAVGHTKATLVAHDWGASVAWHMAVIHPQMVEKLVVLCCPHPSAFQDPERFDVKQLERSKYMLLYNTSGVPESYLRHGDFCELEKALTQAPYGVRTPGAITTADVDRYKAAFAKPGSLTAALNYYRASLRTGTKWLVEEAEKIHYTNITAPVLLMYGDRDPAFLPQMFKGNERLVDCLTTVCLEDCSHWAQQDKPELVNAHIRTILSGKLRPDNNAAPRPSITTILVTAGTAGLQH